MTTLGRVIDAYGAKITRYTKAELDAAAGPFQRIAAESRTRETNYFGSDFQFERLRDDAMPPWAMSEEPALARPRH